MGGGGVKVIIFMAECPAAHQAGIAEGNLGGGARQGLVGGEIEDEGEDDNGGESQDGNRERKATHHGLSIL